MTKRFIASLAVIAALAACTPGASPTPTGADSTPVVASPEPSLPGGDLGSPEASGMTDESPAASGMDDGEASAEPS